MVWISEEARLGIRYPGVTEHGTGGPSHVDGWLYQKYGPTQTADDSQMQRWASTRTSCTCSHNFANLAGGPKHSYETYRTLPAEDNYAVNIAHHPNGATILRSTNLIRLFQHAAVRLLLGETMPADLKRHPTLWLPLLNQSSYRHFHA